MLQHEEHHPTNIPCQLKCKDNLQGYCQGKPDIRIKPVELPTKDEGFYTAEYTECANQK